METESLKALSKSIEKKKKEGKKSMWLGFGLNGTVPSTCVLSRGRETWEPENYSLTAKHS